MKQSLIAVLAGATTLASLAGVGVSAAVTHNVTLIVDGQPSVVRTTAPSVYSLLESRHIAASIDDSVTPPPATPITDGMTVTVDYGRQVDVTIDGAPLSLITTALTVDGTLASLNLTDPTYQVTPDRSTRITDEGLAITVATSKVVSLT
ncbi:MAG: ubiquitin-like domain-containing protein, partial [Actinomycetia bacterium]|nr:ubiquitin-like domain-containing protein [Actinomycetes bacterium]